MPAHSAVLLCLATAALRVSWRPPSLTSAEVDSLVARRTHLRSLSFVHLAATSYALLVESGERVKHRDWLVASVYAMCAERAVAALQCALEAGELRIAAINGVAAEDLLSVTLCGPVERVEAWVAAHEGAKMLTPPHPWHHRMYLDVSSIRDGSKFQAVASQRKHLSLTKLKRQQAKLEAQISRYLA